jgi:hypothetical protein
VSRPHPRALGEAEIPQVGGSFPLLLCAGWRYALSLWAFLMCFSCYSNMCPNKHINTMEFVSYKL